jgi:hypothetical protein
VSSCGAELSYRKSERPASEDEIKGSAEPCSSHVPRLLCQPSPGEGHVRAALGHIQVLHCLNGLRPDPGRRAHAARDADACRARRWGPRAGALVRMQLEGGSEERQVHRVREGECDLACAHGQAQANRGRSSTAATPAPPAGDIAQAGGQTAWQCMLSPSSMRFGH